MKDNPSFTPLTAGAFEKAFTDRGLIEKGDGIVVAVSGGCDSSALLHLICSVREKWELNVICAHVNHNIRGEEALRDENFVRETCRKYGIRCEVLSADVPAFAREHRMSCEDAGRKIRYDFFQSLASELPGGKIATAHTLSDRAETFVFNAARGSSLSGLCGIPAMRGNIIRPLIDFTRDQTEDYCWQNDIEYVTDSTNETDEYTRNRIRHHVIPVLREINPSFERAFARMLRNLEAIDSDNSERAETLMEKARTESGYNAEILSDGTPGYILGTVAAKMLSEFGAEVTNDRALSLAQALASPEDFKIQYSENLFLLKNAGLVFPSEGPGKNPEIPEIPVPGEWTEYLPGRKIRVTVISREEFENLHNVKGVGLKRTYDYDKLEGDAAVRSRASGDRINVHGGTKTLKKLFNEEKIPAGERSSVPVIADAAGPVWIEGLGSDIRCRVTDKTEHVAVVETAHI